MKPLDFSRAVVVRMPGAAGPEAKAVQVLVEEIEKRTGLRLSEAERHSRGVPAITIGTAALAEVLDPAARVELDRLPCPGPEGYRIVTRSGSVAGTLVIGADARGVLFGVGKLLRNLYLDRKTIRLDRPLRLSSTPKYPLRGHQLGYRPINNACDAWTVEQFDQYIRELALFGANAIEIMPGGTDEDDVEASKHMTGHAVIPEDRREATAWPHMRYPYLDMMVRLSGIIRSYGLDVWVWWPNMGKDYKDPACVRAEWKEREKIFRAVPHIDHLFIPGGDPGELGPDELFDWSGKVAELLARFHPQAKIWLSLQAFRQTDAWVETFCRKVREEPPWLGGVVFAPWQKTPLPELRKRIPKRYPIRHYPDITHNLICQYPIPNWDRAFAICEGRECINPMPRMQKHIHNLTAPYTIGSLSYSEGINDDVNKFVWSDQDWDPSTPVRNTLRDYGRLFVGPKHADAVADGLLALERNWTGPLAANEGVERTLRMWQRIEASVFPVGRRGYRLQLGLIRACADAYLRRRLLREASQERRAREALAAGLKTDSRAAARRAARILNERTRQPVDRALRRRCDRLADSLWASIGAQLSVAKHHALAWNRGAFLETLDLPLNDSAWLLARIAEIEAEGEESRRRALIRAALDRADPGPGGYYDNFGSPRSAKRVRTDNWRKDPGNLRSPYRTFAVRLLHLSEEEQAAVGGPVPLAWTTSVGTLYGTPLTIVYDGLNPAARYTLRVTYERGAFGSGKTRLVANGRHTVHEDFQVKDRIGTAEFPVPHAATKTGRLTLTWTTGGGRHGPNVSEIWLIRHL